jgi:hypothetical protein
MLYYGLTEKLSKVSISLTSGIGADSVVGYSGVVHARTSSWSRDKDGRCGHGRWSPE